MGNVYYVHADHLNRPIALTDASKTVVAAFTWLPFGDSYTSSGTVGLDLRFPGQMLQAESGLFYNWYRQYDPTTGRYTQPDPLGLVDGPSRYAYVGNDPLQRVDPEGLKTTKSFGAACRILRVDPNSASGALHAAKRAASLRGDDNCVFDLTNGDIIYNGEVIGNLCGR